MDSGNSAKCHQGWDDVEGHEHILLKQKYTVNINKGTEKVQDHNV